MLITDGRIDLEERKNLNALQKRRFLFIFLALLRAEKVPRCLRLSTSLELIFLAATLRLLISVFVLPVKKLIETGEGWDAGSSVCKIPNYFYKCYRSKDIEIEFNDYLRAGDRCHNSYLLDKNGKQNWECKGRSYPLPSGTTFMRKCHRNAGNGCAKKTAAANGSPALR